MEAKETDERHIPQALVILDDCLGDMTHSRTLDALVTRGRHAGISILASSQVYKGLSSAMRKNFACWALDRMPAVDWKLFEDEHAGSFVSREQLRQQNEEYARRTRTFGRHGRIIRITTTTPQPRVSSCIPRRVPAPSAPAPASTFRKWLQLRARASRLRRTPSTVGTRKHEWA